MSYLFENGNIIGQTLDYRSTVVTTYEDEFNSAANVEVVETQSISFDLINSGVDVSSNNELTLSSTLQEGDIIVVQTFIGRGGNGTDVSDSGSSWVELIGIGRGSFNLNSINTQLVYKVVASGNETTDKTVTWDLADSRGGAIVVLVRGGTATGIQANYGGYNSVDQADFPAETGAPSNSVALLFSALDDDTDSTISSFPSNYTTAEDFSAGESIGNGIKGYAGYREGVTSTENGEGTKSITYSSPDSIVVVSVLIPRNVVNRTAKTNSGVWDTQAVYDDKAFDADANPEILPTLTYLDSGNNTSTNTTIETSPSFSLGSADDNRYIVIGISSLAGSNLGPWTSAEISIDGGAYESIYTVVNYTGGTEAYGSDGLYIIHAPTGSNATVRLTYGSNTDRNSAFVAYRLIHNTGIPYGVTYEDGADTLTLRTQTNGVGLFVAIGTNGTTGDPTGFTEEFEFDFRTSDYFAGGKFTGAEGGTRTLAHTAHTTTDSLKFAASWAPWKRSPETQVYNAFEISTLEFQSALEVTATSEGNDSRGVYVSPDGLHLYLINREGNGTIHQYSMSEDPYYIFSATYIRSQQVDNNVDATGITFSNDGTTVAYCGSGTDTVRYATLSTAWDISTMGSSSLAQSGFNLSNLSSIQFINNGQYFAIGSRTGGTIYRVYQLASAYDLSTAGTLISSRSDEHVKMAYKIDGSVAIGGYAEQDPEDPDLELLTEHTFGTNYSPSTFTQTDTRDLDLFSRDFNNLDAICTSTEASNISHVNRHVYYYDNTSEGLVHLTATVSVSTDI